jgi:hypothetical protein
VFENMFHILPYDASDTQVQNCWARLQRVKTRLFTSCFCESVTLTNKNLYRVLPVAYLQSILLCLHRLTQLKECVTFNLIYWYHNMFWPFSVIIRWIQLFTKCFFELQTILLLIWAHIYNNCSGGWQYWHPSILHIKLSDSKTLKLKY